MKDKGVFLLFVSFFILFSCQQPKQTAKNIIPYLEKKGNTTQLIVDGKWIPGRRLAGDDTAQGNNLRFGAGYNILKVTLYSYK
jgi:hypothetical protein